MIAYWASDDMINEALERWARRAQGLTRAELVIAGYRLRDALVEARPEWRDDEIEAAIACVLRERDRVRRAKRRAAA